jgi:hypothetical protein
MRERMIVAFDRAVRVAGAPSFDEGMCQAKTVLGIVSNWPLFVSDFLKPIETIEGLRKALDSRMSLPEREQTMFLFALENLPDIVREGSRMAASTTVL